MLKRKTYRKKLRDQQPRSKKFRSGDQVIALTGNNRGRIGTILSIKGTKAIVQGLNLRKKCVKKSQLNPTGSIIEREMPIHISNLRVCVNGKPVKLKTRFTENGGKELYYMDGENAVAYRTIQNSK